MNLSTLITQFFGAGYGFTLRFSVHRNQRTASNITQEGVLGAQHIETTPGVITTAQATEPLPSLAIPPAAVTTVTPHEPPDVAALANRQYLVATLTWGEANARGSEIGRVDLPRDLASFPVLARKLGDYFYFRADAEVEIRILSSTYNYGALGFAWNYAYPFPDGHYDCRDWRQLWQHHSGIITPQDREGVKFKMPWSTNRSFAKNGSWGTEIGTIVFFTASPLKSIDDNPSDIQVQVFVTLSNVKLIGPDPTITVAAQGRRKKWKTPAPRERYNFAPGEKDALRRAVEAELEADRLQAGAASGQNAPIKKEAEEKSKKGVISGFVRNVGDIATLAAPIPIIGTVAGAIGAGAKALAPILESFGLTKPTSQMAPQPTYDVNNLELVHMTGLSRVNRLGPAPDDFVDQPVNAVPGQDWDPSIYEFIQRPGYLDAFQWSSSGSVSGTLYECWVDPLLSADDAYVSPPYVVVPTPLAYMAQYFAAYRGGIKYFFTFIAHPFIKGKVRISFSPSGLFHTPLEEVGGDMISRTVDVQGTTTVEFTIPYFGELPWYPIQDIDGSNISIPYGMHSGAFAAKKGGWGKIRVSVVNPLIVTDTVVDPIVDVLVFSGAAEDAQLSRLTGRNTIFTTHVLGNVGGGLRRPDPLAKKDSGIVITKQCSLEATFGKEFPGLGPGMQFNADRGYVNPLADMTFRTNLHRYSVTGATVANGVIPVEPFWRGGVGDTYLESLDKSVHSEWSQLFLFWRGDMRFAYMSAVDPATSPVEYSVKPLAHGGIMTAVNRYTPGTLFVPGPDRNHEMFYLEVPWYDVVPFRAVFDDWLGPDLVQCLDSDSADQQFIWRAIGDSFGLACPTACPLMTFAPASAGAPQPSRQFSASGVPKSSAGGPPKA